MKEQIISPNNIRLLMFDLDDTLYKFSYYWPRALRSSFKKSLLTCELNEDDLFVTFERYSNELWELVGNKEITFDEYRYMRLSHALREYNIDITQTEFSEFNQIFIKENLEMIDYDEKLVSLIERLARRYRLAIVTNGPGDITMDKIIRIGIGHLFDSDSVFISEKIGFSKPDPRIFNLVLEKNEVTAEEAIFIGDSWAADIVGPMEIGIGTIWINNNNQKPLSDHKPYTTVTDVYRINEILA